MTVASPCSGSAIPVFVLGLTLQYIFAVQLKILPAAGRIDPRRDLEIQSNFVLIDSLLIGPARRCSSTASST